MAIGNIKVDIDSLSSLVSTLGLIKSGLDLQANSIMALNTQVDQAIVGTVSSISSFDQLFNGWAKDLQNVASEMDQAYTTLSNVLADAQKLAGDL